MTGAECSDAERRVWALLPEGTRAALCALSPTDLQTLLLSIARDRVARTRPADLLRRWCEDRFVRPSTSDPRSLVDLEAGLWRLLPAEVSGVELSPVTPLGSCSVVSGMSQNRIVSTTRTAEVATVCCAPSVSRPAGRRTSASSHWSPALAMPARAARTLNCSACTWATGSGS